MKVNDFISLNKLYMNIDNEIFKLGNLIEGEIIDIVDDLVIIDIKGAGIIKARTHNNLKDQKDEILNFIVKSSLPNKIELKPVFNNLEGQEIIEITDKTKDYLINILKEFHIDINSISIDFLDNLIKYNVQINKENIINGIKIFEKLEQILNIDEDEIITLIGLKEENINIGNEDIRNFIVANINEDNKLTNGELTINKSLIESLEIKLDPDMIKTISFFIKYNIKPSINNIKYFEKVKETSDLFSEDFKILKDMIDKKFTNLGKRIIINNVGSKNIIEESNSKYKNILDKMIYYAKEYASGVENNLKSDIKEIINKFEFLHEMNKELNFIYLPLNLINDNYKGSISFLKKKKRKIDFDDKINIFINLNMKNLGNITMECEILNRIINIKFMGINKGDLELFKANENKLKAIGESIGYKINSIEYSFDKNNNILESLIVNKSSIYNLDLQV